jgi:hypothetical protein
MPKACFQHDALDQDDTGCTIVEMIANRFYPV